jgi:hypothetical protein
MSDETQLEQEIPAGEQDARSQELAIDRDGGPRSSPPIGAALSVLWWVEGEPFAE